VSAYLEDITLAGSVAVAAIVERSARWGTVPAIWFLGTKRPVAVLVYQDGQAEAFEPDGARLSRDALEQSHPGLHAEFVRQCTATRPGS